MQSGTTGQTSITTIQTQDDILRALRDRIVSGQVPVGSKLPSERALSETFNVSRTVVREVLKVLAEQRLIETLPGKGAYVRAASVGDAASALETVLHRSQATPRHLAEARMTLECESAALAAQRAGTRDLQLMERALMGCETSDSVLEKTRYDIAFHTTLIRAARNPVIEIMCGSISGLTAEMMLRSLGDPIVARDGIPYHRSIYDAIRTHDPESARTEMAAHLEVAIRRYGEDLDRSLNTIARREVARLLGHGATPDDVLATIGLLGENDG